MSLKVVPLHQSAVHTPKALADALRQMADDIENGKITGVERLHALIEHSDDSLSYSLVGKNCGFMHRVGVFSTAAMIAADPGAI